MSHLQAVSDNGFDELINGNEPVLVDFWAAWCAPCKALGPIFEETAADYQGKVKFVKMDVDNNPNTPAKFGVRSIPTLLLFKAGQLKATHIGMTSKAELSKFIDTHLG